MLNRAYSFGIIVNSCSGYKTFLKKKWTKYTEIYQEVNNRGNETRNLGIPASPFLPNICLSCIDLGCVLVFALKFQTLLSVIPSIG